MSNGLACFLYVLFSLIGMTFIKMGAVNADGKAIIIPFVGEVVSVKTLIGIGFYGLSFLLYVFCISRMKIGIVIPLLAAINSCIIVLIGIGIFGEHIGKLQMIGIFIVIIGAFLIGVGTSS